MKASQALSTRGDERTPDASGVRVRLADPPVLSAKGSCGMAYVASASLTRQLGALFEGGSVAGLSDRQLLERFTARREPADEAAFAAIVARHGPMVLGLCRQLLGDHQHAEDAFQAVFLVLARQARSIRDPDALGAWLYGVALRTARKARGRLARLRQTEEAGAARAARMADSSALRRRVSRFRAQRDVRSATPYSQLPSRSGSRSEAARRARTRKTAWKASSAS